MRSRNGGPDDMLVPGKKYQPQGQESGLIDCEYLIPLGDI